MHAQVGDLCFTPDGIAKKGVLVRHLVMPGLEAEGARIMQFLAEVSKDCFVNIMGTTSSPSPFRLEEETATGWLTVHNRCSCIEQYHPDAHVGKPKRRTGASKETATEEAEPSKDSLRYADINRAVSTDEIGTVRRAAEVAGLWRFCDPVRHDGFNL